MGGERVYPPNRGVPPPWGALTPPHPFARSGCTPLRGLVYVGARGDAGRSMKRVCGWVVVAAVGGCANAGGSSSSSSGAPTPTRTAAELSRDYAMAQCARQQRCAAEQGAGFVTQEACLADLSFDETLYTNMVGVSFFELATSGLEVADQLAGQRCLDHLDQNPCTDAIPRDPDCDAALRVVGAVGVGQACGASSGSGCDEGLYCGPPSANACSVCTALEANGAACTQGSQCTSGFCSTSRLCADPAFKTAGQPCASGAECLGNLVCAGPSASRTCQQAGGAGTACGGEAPPCQGGLVCVTNPLGDNGMCTAPLADGQTCQRRDPGERLTSPGCLHVCQFATAGANTGTCGIPTAPIAAGDPCIRLRTGTSLTCSLVASELFADFTFNIVNGRTEVTSCTCQPRHAEGQACYAPEACTTAVCEGANMGAQMPGMCAPQIANGQPCSTNAGCASGYCTLQAALPLCADRPACP